MELPSFLEVATYGFWATLGLLWTILSSNLITALAGAFAGAYGGQWIVRKFQEDKELLEEIRSTNAAITVSIEICNTCLALKRQHVRSLKENFEQQKQQLELFKERRDNGLIGRNETFEYEADFTSLEPISLPADVLQNLLFEKISVSGRALMIAANLPRTLSFLNSAIEKRNDLISKAVQDGGMSAQMYFGLPQGDRVDERYPSSIEGIYSYTDDCIYFSHLLYEDLVSHAKELASVLGKEAPRIYTFDFTAAREQNLMPPPEGYADWNRIFAGIQPTGDEQK